MRRTDAAQSLPRQSAKPPPTTAHPRRAHHGPTKSAPSTSPPEALRPKAPLHKVAPGRAELRQFIHCDQQSVRSTPSRRPTPERCTKGRFLAKDIRVGIEIGCRALKVLSPIFGCSGFLALASSLQGMKRFRVGSSRRYTATVAVIGLAVLALSGCWGSRTRPARPSASHPPEANPVPRHAHVKPFKQQPLPVSPTVVGLSVGYTHSCALLSDGTARCWGDNAAGQLGRGEPGGSGDTAAVLGLRDAKALATGNEHTCALSKSGAVSCWGDNASGQLGEGTQQSGLSPVEVVGLSDVVALTAGMAHTCALQSSGAVFCWGENGVGELGDGSIVSRSSPVKSLVAAEQAAVDAGHGHTCALSRSGSVSCWGANTMGQLGNGTRRSSAKPVVVPLSEAAVEISAGGNHTCARLEGGSVVCWGERAGAMEIDTSPALVPGLDDAVALSTGYINSLALQSTGEVWVWGATGVLRPGVLNTSALPVRVGQIEAKAISAGYAHSCALTRQGAVVCWGQNGDGQLGHGARLESDVPVTVRGLPSSPEIEAWADGGS